MTKQDPQNYWEQLQRLEKLIRASEFKAGVIFSFHSLIIGIFVDRLEILRDAGKIGPFFIAILVIWLAFVFISIFFCFRCFYPKLELKYKKNPFFFRDAALSFGNLEEFSKTYVDMCADPESLFNTLSQQIYIESHIVDQKFRSVQRSLLFFVFSFATDIVIIIYWVTRF